MDQNISVSLQLPDNLERMLSNITSQVDALGRSANSTSSAWRPMQAVRSALTILEVRTLLSFMRRVGKDNI